MLEEKHLWGSCTVAGRSNHFARYVIAVVEVSPTMLYLEFERATSDRLRDDPEWRLRLTFYSLHLFSFFFFIDIEYIYYE